MENMARHPLQVEVATEGLSGGVLFLEFPRLGHILDHIVWFPTVEQLHAMPEEDRVSRNIIFLVAFAAVTLITTIVGTVVLARPCRRRLRSLPPPETELVQWTESAATEGLDAGTSARVLFEDLNDGDGGQARCRSRFCLIPMCTHILLCSSACAVSLRKKQLSPDTGLNWEYYLMIWTVNALWMNLQATIRVCRASPSTSFALPTFPVAALAGTAPYLSEWFDTLLDTIFGFMCLASPHGLVQVLGVVALVWLLLLHVVLALCWNDAAVEIFSAYFSVLDAEPIDPRLKELPFSTKLWVNLYSQCSPVRRRMTEMEDLPQAVFKMIYAYFEAPSFAFTAVMILIPLCKIVAGYCFQPCLARRIVPFWRRRLMSALVCDSQEKLREVDEVLCLDGRGELLAAVLDPVSLPSLGEDRDVEGQTNVRDELLNMLLECGADYSPLSKLTSLWMQLVGGAESTPISLEVQNTELHLSHLCFLTRRTIGVNLRKLSISGIPLPNSELKILANSVMLTVEELGLVNCHIGDAGAGIIGIGMKRSQRLCHLDLTENEIGVKGGQAIGLCLKDAQKLQWLHLSVQGWRSVTGEPGAMFVQTLTEQARPLQVLSLSVATSSSPTGKPTPAIPRGKATPLPLPWSRLLLAPANLTTLTLNGYIVDASQAKDIGEALAENISLTHLDLSCNNLGDIGVEKLVINLEENNSTLKKLYLRHVNCTDRAVLSLNMFHLPHLRYLDLLGNKISHEATQNLLKSAVIGTCVAYTVCTLVSRVSQFYMGDNKPLEASVVQSLTYEEAKLSELHRACYEGDVQFVEHYIQNEVIQGVEMLDGQNRTPLAVAARYDELQIVKLLLAARADPTCGNNTGLDDAVELQHSDVATALLRSGAGRAKIDVTTVAFAAPIEGALELIDVGINTQDNEGQTPLFMASMKGTAKHVAALVAARADVNIATSHLCDYPGEVPLIIACRRMKSTVHVQSMLQATLQAMFRPDDLRSKINEGGSTLHIACEGSAAAIVRVLLDAGADINALDSNRKLPLYIADEAAVARVLVEKKASVDDDCLFGAATMPYFEGKDPEKLKILLDAKANPNTSRNGWPLLFYIATHSHLQGWNVPDKEEEQLEMMRAVIAARADVNCFADGSEHEGLGGSCIAQVVANKRLDMLQLLISSRAQVDLPTQASGKTALFFACEGNCVAAAEMLLNASADPNIANKAGDTPLQLAQGNTGLKYVFENNREASGSVHPDSEG